MLAISGKSLKKVIFCKKIRMRGFPTNSSDSFLCEIYSYRCLYEYVGKKFRGRFHHGLSAKIKDHYLLRLHKKILPHHKKCHWQFFFSKILEFSADQRFTKFLFLFFVFSKVRKKIPSRNFKEKMDNITLIQKPQFLCSKVFFFLIFTKSSTTGI